MAETKTSQSWFNELLPVLEAVAQDEWASINMPYSEAVAEGERMVVVSDEDRAELLAVGIDPDYIDTLDARVGAFAHTVALADLYASESSASVTDWKALKAAGYALRQELLAAFEYAFYGNQNALQKLNQIMKGRGDKDMLQDLLALAMLGDEFPQLLEAINFDQALLDQARDMNKRLADLLAQKTLDPQKIDEYKILRMNAWTYLHQALSEIYRTGRYVFRNQPERRELYFIDYLQTSGSTVSAENEGSAEE